MDRIQVSSKKMRRLSISDSAIIKKKQDKGLWVDEIKQ